MPTTEDLRIDKFLWAVRIYKTRTLAAEACAKGQVTISNMPVKPSRSVKISEIFMVRKPPIVQTYKVLTLVHNRLPAAKVKEYIEDLTPQEEFQKLEVMKLQKNAIRDRGTGRPTKRDRRDMERFTGNS